MKKIAYRGPALQQKIRKIVTNNSTGDVFGITIPRLIAEQFSGCFLRIHINGNTLIMESGCKMSSGDIVETKWNEYDGMRKIYDSEGRVQLVK